MGFVPLMYLADEDLPHPRKGLCVLVSSLKGTTTHLDHFLSVYHPSLAPFSMPHILLPFLIILASVSIYGLQELVMDREPWRAAVHMVTKSRTRLNN